MHAKPPPRLLGDAVRTRVEFHAYIVELLTTGDGAIERIIAREVADQIIETLESNPQLARWIADEGERGEPHQAVD